DDLVVIDFFGQVEEFTGVEKILLARIQGIELSVGPLEEGSISLFLSEGDGEWHHLSNSFSYHQTFRFDRRNGRNVYDIEGTRNFLDRPIPDVSSPSSGINLFAYPTMTVHVQGIKITNVRGARENDTDDDGI